MSRMAALVFLGAIAAASPPSGPPDPGITADQAMAAYRAKLAGAMPGAGPAACPKQDPEQTAREIVVCGRDVHPAPRLPLPDERAEAGEVVHHVGEPGRGDPGPLIRPSRLMETIGKGVRLLKSAVTGEDPTG